MTNAKDVISNIEDVIDAVINTRYIDEVEMWEHVKSLAELRVNRLRALDPQRNR